MLVQAFSFKKWSDERTLRAIENVDSLKFSSSYTFMLQQLNHIVAVEELFKSRLTNCPAPHKSTKPDLVPEFSELSQRLMTSNDWYSGFVSELENKQKQIVFTFADGKPGMLTIEEILFHIVTHGSYHRGNIAYALDLSEVPHPVEAYGLYIHEREPARRGSC